MGSQEPEKGDKVSWNWGGGAPGGTVAETKKEGEIAIESKRGNTIKKNASPDNPAVHISRSGNDVVKRASELTVEEKAGGHKGEKRKADDDKPDAEGKSNGKNEKDDDDDKENGDDNDDGPHEKNADGKEVKKGGKDANKKQKRDQDEDVAKEGSKKEDGEDVADENDENDENEDDMDVDDKENGQQDKAKSKPAPKKNKTREEDEEAAEEEGDAEYIEEDEDAGAEQEEDDGEAGKDAHQLSSKNRSTPKDGKQANGSKSAKSHDKSEAQDGSGEEEETLQILPGLSAWTGGMQGMLRKGARSTRSEAACGRWNASRFVASLCRGRRSSSKHTVGVLCPWINTYLGTPLVPT
ncbi:uncharacterized protein B0I36DRAFT_350190 [Microdochium trichocladiopsis]|uniref:Hypervirulence associated protein TUDOR domain-containing protein n=1 Tax=Microdochium trichocladiopsis TaxID=1682393 RepID=A0A9P8Y3Y4_9PEZI|nr:uncharacterized protein B0I36DRAFT_350190 [Microdochium trichocladiopsis]KAH7029283.1 hypothetical protein B0I36DRAFT_350190 [Microdochium trichocladiopsis]